jgi:hypothetical protein
MFKPTNNVAIAIPLDIYCEIFQNLRIIAATLEKRLIFLSLSPLAGGGGETPKTNLLFSSVTAILLRRVAIK